MVMQIVDQDVVCSAWLRFVPAEYGEAIESVADEGGMGGGGGVG